MGIRVSRLTSPHPTPPLPLSFRHTALLLPSSQRILEPLPLTRDVLTSPPDAVLCVGHLY